MDTTIIIALIALAGSIIATLVSSYFSKKREIEVERQRDKLNHYKVLLSALSDLSVSGYMSDSGGRYSLAVNTIALVAEQGVVTALMEFNQYLIKSKDCFSVEKHDELLRKLLLAIRKDVGFIKSDDEKSFIFSLVQSGGKSSTSYCSK